MTNPITNSQNYQQTTSVGTKWRRSNRVNVENPYEGMPYIHFTEEDIIALQDGTIIHQDVTDPSQTVTQDFSAPDTAFPLINPDTGDVIGSATYSQFYVYLHSLYMSLAKKRDQKNQPKV